MLFSKKNQCNTKAAVVLNQFNPIRFIFAQKCSKYSPVFEFIQYSCVCDRFSINVFTTTLRYNIRNQTILLNREFRSIKNIDRFAREWNYCEIEKRRQGRWEWKRTHKNECIEHTIVTIQGNKNNNTTAAQNMFLRKKNDECDIWRYIQTVRGLFTTALCIVCWVWMHLMKRNTDRCQCFLVAIQHVRIGAYRATTIATDISVLKDNARSNQTTKLKKESKMKMKLEQNCFGVFSMYWQWNWQQSDINQTNIIRCSVISPSYFTFISMLDHDKVRENVIWFLSATKDYECSPAWRTHWNKFCIQTFAGST